MRSVAIIGSGFSGLSAACCLAADGYQVTVLEKNESAGGRARKFEAEGYVFDMGPSWYWMPDVMEKFFKRFGKEPSDYFDLVRLDPSYRVFFSRDDILDLPAGLVALEKTFESIEPGSGARLRAFLNEAQAKYELGINRLVYKPGLSLSELADVELLKGLLKLDVFKSSAVHIRKYFRDPKLIRVLEFPLLFLGATAQSTPALYSLMNYADMGLGTWYPMGGMYKLVDGMKALAESLGVRFEFNSTVHRVSVAGRRATGLVVNGVEREFDSIVASADYQHVEQSLVPSTHRKYSSEYWKSRVMAPSSLIFYLGISKRLDQLLHHNLFFDEDLEMHASQIYEDPQWPIRPLFYVCCPSKTDPTVAPEGHENLFILIPVAPGLKDSPDIRERYFTTVISRLESLTGQSIAKHVAYKRGYAHNDFINDYNAFQGNAYGLANTLLQTAYFKPSMVNKRVTNLFYTGQLTVPGPGVPSSVISGQVAAEALIKRDKHL